MQTCFVLYFSAAWWLSSPVHWKYSDAFTSYTFQLCDRCDCMRTRHILMFLVFSWATRKTSRRLRWYDQTDVGLHHHDQQELQAPRVQCRHAWRVRSEIFCQLLAGSAVIFNQCRSSLHRLKELKNQHRNCSVDACRWINVLACYVTDRLSRTYMLLYCQEVDFCQFLLLFSVLVFPIFCVFRHVVSHPFRATSVLCAALSFCITHLCVFRFVCCLYCDCSFLFFQMAFLFPHFSVFVYLFPVLWALQFGFVCLMITAEVAAWSPQRWSLQLTGILAFLFICAFLLCLRSISGKPLPPWYRPSALSALSVARLAPAALLEREQQLQIAMACIVGREVL